MADPIQLTLRSYLTFNVMYGGRGSTNMFTAIEAVASTAIAHPEWPMDEKRTWAEWAKWESRLESRT